MAIQAPEGTHDMLPKQAFSWQNFQNAAYGIFSKFGYEPIQTPLFEQTDLFVRGIGQATDVVSKEMFSALSGENLKKLLAGESIKNKSKLSLRPEGTAGVVRAVAEHNLVEMGAAPAKLMYAGPMFRAERPQKGRLRQFHQIGIECLGADAPSIDAEAIIMLMQFFASIGISEASLTLLINSMGCDKCRPAYREALLEFLCAHESELCETCRTRANLNPLRVFDCKNPQCAALMEKAPKISDYICDDCKAHYSEVCALLDGAQIAYVQDFKLVRGLDYYMRTVFEVQMNEGLGSQNALGGGGRYDKLSEEVGGRAMGGFGFALGYERCVLALEALGKMQEYKRVCDVFVACVSEHEKREAFFLAQACRNAGLICDIDHQNRSLKSQFKLADKQKARYVVVLGPDELANKKAKIRNMQTHEECLVAFDELPAFVVKELA